MERAKGSDTLIMDLFVQTPDVAKGMRVFRWLVFFAGFATDVGHARHNHITRHARPQGEGYDGCLGVDGFQHFFGNALGLNRDNTDIFHPLQRFINLHRLVGFAPPTTQAPAIVAEGRDQTDMALHWNILTRHHLHRIE